MAATGGKGDGNRKARQEALALALARGLTVKDAAAEAHVAERTVRYWFEDQAFRDLVGRLRGELFGLAVGRLAGLAGEAADTLGGLMAAGDEKVRLQAAKAVLEVGARLREQAELAGELADLRRQVEELNRARGSQGRIGPTEEAGGVEDGGEPDAGPEPAAR